MVKASKKAPHWRFGDGDEFEPPPIFTRSLAGAGKATTAASVRPERIEQGVEPSKSARSAWRPFRQPSRDHGRHDSLREQQRQPQRLLMKYGDGVDLSCVAWRRLGARSGGA